MINILSFVITSIFIYMTLWFLISLILNRNDIADIAWGLGFIFVIGGIAFKYNINTINFLVIFLLTTVWGLRLAIHIFLRNKNRKEDKRYLAWRESWGKWFYLRSYLQVFLLQGFFMLLISMSAMVASGFYLNKATFIQITDLNIINIVGILIWLTGFIFESFGDYQLASFLRNPINKGKIMRSGLWKFTRHPNYFGEVTQWWGIFLIVVTSPYGLLAIISPLTISWLILKVSGIPMTEKPYENNKEFIDYKKVTNAFFPWFPKKA